MGFPNVDLYLTGLFYEKLLAMRQDPGTIVNDVFSDLTDRQRAQIVEYFMATIPTEDVKDREEGERRLYILPHFPTLTVPFPQIGISVGNEPQAERFIGNDIASDPEEVIENGEIVAWDYLKGYLGSGTWSIDIIAATKLEVVWISRICQRFICGALGDMEERGVCEVAIALQDVKLADGLTQPNDIFNRSITLTAGKVFNIWRERTPNGTYDTGINTALLEPLQEGTA